MLSLEEQNYLFGMREFGGKSLNEIAKETGHHFNTVKKYADCDDWNEERNVREKRASGLEPLKEVIDDWITEDLKRKRKHRRTGTKIYNDLRESEEHGKLLTVGKHTVINYVSKRKREFGQESNGTAMYLTHPKGSAQVDFGEILVVGKNGVEEKSSELVLSFPDSNAGFNQVSVDETAESLCDALIRIFEFIGGVPPRILFDNMSSAVVHIEAHGRRQLSEIFLRFTMHYRFAAVFCNPDSPQEKGNVENKVGYLRRNYLLPPPKIEDLEAFNCELLEKCKKDLNREHYRKNEQISELFRAEQEVLLPLPEERFEVFTLERVKTDKYSFFRHDNNFYSTSPEYVRCEMWLEIGAGELRILNDNYEEVVRHRRLNKKSAEPVINFENYVGDLIRKPRAFQASPYFSTLPDVVQKHLNGLTYLELKKTLLLLLPIIRADRIGDAAAVLELSNIRNADDFEAAFRALTEDPHPIPDAENAPKQEEYLPNLDPYSALQGGGE